MLYLMSTLMSLLISEEQELKQVRNPEAGNDAEAMGRDCLPTLLPMAYSFCFVIKLRTTSPHRAGTTYNWLGPSHQSLTKKMPYVNRVLKRYFLN